MEAITKSKQQLEGRVGHLYDQQSFYIFEKTTRVQKIFVVH